MQSKGSNIVSIYIVCCSFVNSGVYRGQREWMHYIYCFVRTTGKKILFLQLSY